MVYNLFRTTNYGFLNLLRWGHYPYILTLGNTNRKLEHSRLKFQVDLGEFPYQIVVVPWQTIDMVVDAFRQYNERGHLQSISVSHNLLINAFFLHAHHNLSQKHKSANHPKTPMIKTDWVGSRSLQYIVLGHLDFPTSCGGFGCESNYSHFDPNCYFTFVSFIYLI